MKIYPISLGCPKNRTDTEKLLACLLKKGIAVTSNPQEAEILFINTCAFIREAVEESIDHILELAEQKVSSQRLIVAGCLVTRYKQKLLSLFPEVDLFLGIEPYKGFKYLLSSPPKRLVLNLKGPDTIERVLSFNPFYSYLKIGEGCNHFCSFCIIPKLRGKLKSRSERILLEEAQFLVSQGVKEIILVAQDVSAYGKDNGKEALPSLLKELSSLEDLVWLRLLYLHPLGINEELLEVMASSSKICPYLDIPIQHASPRVLKAMKRLYGPEYILKLVEKIRSFLPEAALRTSVIVGFPGETEEDFSLLLELVKEICFDHLGVFVFSPEEGTLAEKFSSQIPLEIAQERKERLLEIQRTISRDLLYRKIGKETEVLVEGVNEAGFPFGHAIFQAPEIDGKVFFLEPTMSGELVKVKIEKAGDYDLWARKI